jgi:hypothetical protein
MCPAVCDREWLTEESGDLLPAFEHLGFWFFALRHSASTMHPCAAGLQPHAVTLGFRLQSDSLSGASGIYSSTPRDFESTCKGEFLMAEAPRIAVEELKRRIEAGEDFTIIDVRKSEVWAESDTQIPEAIRVPLEKIELNLPRIPKERPVVAYCT